MKNMHTDDELFNFIGFNFDEIDSILLFCIIAYFNLLPI